MEARRLPDDAGDVEFVAYDKPPKAIIAIPEDIVYPDIAKSAVGVEGTVFVKFYIDKKGNVEPNKISIIKELWPK